MLFAKRAFNALSSSSRCSPDKFFLLRSMFRALVALMVVASRVPYLLLLDVPPHGGSFGLSLRSYPFAVSTPYGVRPLLHPRSSLPGGSVCVPSFPSRQELAGKARVPPRQTPPAARVVSIRFPYPLTSEASEANFLPHTKSRPSCVGILFHPLQAECNPAKVSCGHWVTLSITDHLTIIGRSMSTAASPKS